MPVNGRQLSQLYLMAPGSTTAGGGSYDNIRFNGRSNQSNEIRYDGIEGSSVVDQSPGQSERRGLDRLPATVQPRERAGVSSGVEQLSGGIRNWHRRSDFDRHQVGRQRFPRLDVRISSERQTGRAQFLRRVTKSPLRLNQYGGSIGGPIKKDKIFFFSSLEALNQRSGVSLIATVPSAAARARAVSSIQPLMAAFPVGQTPSSNPDLDFVRKDASSAIDEYYGGVRLDYRF